MSQYCLLFFCINFNFAERLVINIVKGMPKIFSAVLIFIHIIEVILYLIPTFLLSSCPISKVQISNKLSVKAFTKYQNISQ